MRKIEHFVKEDEISWHFDVCFVKKVQYIKLTTNYLKIVAPFSTGITFLYAFMK